MNFTKKYIKECDCEEIQKLKGIEYGDWIFDITTDLGYEFDEHNCGVYTQKMFSYVKGVDIWLPTGDQLDDEILKTSSKHRHYAYSFNYWFKQKIYQVIIDGSILREASSKNKYIAKIKLLKVLLREEKG